MPWGSAQSSILVALYDIASKKLASLLNAAAKRGVTVTVIYDKARAEENQQSQIPYLRTCPGITCVASRCDATFHHKCAIIDDQLWTGSMN